MSHKPIGIILAGGRGNRLGGLDKGLFKINDRPLIELCVANLRPQVGSVIISANSNLSVYHQYADIVVPDKPSAYPQANHIPEYPR